MPVILIQGGAQFAAGVSTGGNTAGNTGSQVGTVVLQATGGVTLSQATGAAGVHTVQVSVATGGGGATVSQWPGIQLALTLSSLNSGTTAATGGSTQTTASFAVFPFPLQAALSFSRIDAAASLNQPGGTGSVSVAHMLGIYTLNASTLSLYTSYLQRHEMSGNSAATAQSHYWYWGTNSTSNSSSSGGNILSIFAGTRWVSLLGSADSLSAGQYFCAYGYVARTSNSAVYHESQVLHVSDTLGSNIGELGVATTLAVLPLYGVVSVTTNTNVLTGHCIPASIDITNITRSASTHQRWPYLRFVGGTL